MWLFYKLKKYKTVKERNQTDFVDDWFIIIYLLTINTNNVILTLHNYDKSKSNPFDY